MKRIVVILTIAITLGTGYLLYNNNDLQAGNGTTSTTVYGENGGSEIKRTTGTSTINGEKITLSPAAINLSKTFREMLGDAPAPSHNSDDDSDDDEDDSAPIIDMTKIFKIFSITPVGAAMLNALGTFISENPTANDATIVQE